MSVRGQGNVNFANVSVGLISPFLDRTVVDFARINGGTWTNELLAGPDSSPDSSSLVLAGPAYMGAFANGFFNAGQRTISNVNGGLAFAQVRVWDNRGGTITSWAQATSIDGLRFGASTVFAINLTVLPATPATMVNMPAITVGPIPEPSTIVLGLLGGLGALLFRPRK